MGADHPSLTTALRRQSRLCPPHPSGTIRPHRRLIPCMTSRRPRFQTGRKQTTVLRGCRHQDVVERCYQPGRRYRDHVLSQLHPRRTLGRRHRPRHRRHRGARRRRHDLLDVVPAHAVVDLRGHLGLCRRPHPDALGLGRLSPRRPYRRPPDPPPHRPRRHLPQDRRHLHPAQRASGHRLRLYRPRAGLAAGAGGGGRETHGRPRRHDHRLVAPGRARLDRRGAHPCRSGRCCPRKASG